MNTLQDIYNSYLSCANSLDGWENISKSELCNLYIKHEDNNYLRNQYMSAIVCKYWPKIYRFYKATPLVCTMEDCYDWLIQSILESLHNRVWLIPGNKLENDPNGPDKVINCMMKCFRLNHLVAVNRDKRKININTLSKDELDDTLSEDYYCAKESESYTKDLFNELDGTQLVTFFYNRQEFALMFILDVIINLDCDIKNEFNKKKLTKQLVSLDDNYLSIMSDRYEIPFDELKFLYNSSIQTKNAIVINKVIDNSFNILRGLIINEEI